ncbi:MAG: ABC transporter ATP-binding protein [Deltaproteobacteria bacterium]|nr:ABC transporter ATP-binding protein [Deltaproteobacteria bacterium]
MSGEIDVEGVVRRYGDATVLHGVSLTVEAGAFAALVGPSGSGKTTLLNLIGGLDRPDAGRIVVDGLAVSDLGADARATYRRDRVGFIFQTFNLIDVLSAQENVELPLALLGVPPRRRAERAAAMLAEVGLADHARKLPTQMSGGQQQRVAVARALVKNPALVLGDEPTANLDAATGVALMDMLAALNERRGTTLVIATHDPRMVERTRVAYTLSDGRLVSS